MEEIILEIDNLISLQSRVGNALEATREPLRVTVLCLEERLGWKMMKEKDILNNQKTNASCFAALHLKFPLIVTFILSLDLAAI